jgi:hypothetical protein
MATQKTVCVNCEIYIVFVYFATFDLRCLNSKLRTALLIMWCMKTAPGFSDDQFPIFMSWHMTVMSTLILSGTETDHWWERHICWEIETIVTKQYNSIL